MIISQEKKFKNPYIPIEQANPVYHKGEFQSDLVAFINNRLIENLLKQQKGQKKSDSLDPNEYYE